jgi:starch-binding outer membrane protein, SusD/RagB family
MKLKNITPWILAVFFLLQISCSEDFLAPKPLSFLSPENVYTSKAGFESALMSMRKNIIMDSHGAQGTAHMLQETQSSDVGVANFAIDYRQFMLSTNNNLWTTMFQTIYRYLREANVVISRIDDAKWTSEAEKNAVLAEAYFFRSYWYYRLVNSWGDVPWVGSEVKDVKLDYQTYSRWAILKKIQTDMEWAVQWMPTAKIASQPNKYAAYHLLSKICLANCEFDKAIDACNQVINGPYALMTNRFGVDKSIAKCNVMWDLHRRENKNITENTENILAVVERYESPTAAKQFSIFSTSGTLSTTTIPGVSTMRFYNCTWWHSLARDSEGKRPTLDSGPQYNYLGRGNPDCPMPDWLAYGAWAYGGQTWKNTTDLRRADTCWTDKKEIISNNPASKDYGKPVNPMYLATLVDSNTVFFANWCMKTWNKQDNPAATPVGGDADWYVFRLAETYLNRAEAYFWKNDLTNAAADVNKIRLRAQALPITPAEVTLDFIFDERARELWIEEKRHNELVRASYILAKLNKDGYSLPTFSDKNWAQERVLRINHWYSMPITRGGFTATWLPYHSLWPIPDQVITANTGAVINQNKGYNGYENNIPVIETIE